MENKLNVTVDPKEFGLEKKEVKTIEDAFIPKITEREALKKVYENLLNKEITPQLCNEAKSVRLKLVKVRTGIAEIHKSQKAFFLAAGRFVDAWKNKETLPVTQMEEKLSEIEEYYERIEQEKISKLQKERSAELLKYQDEDAFIPVNLGDLTDEVWNNYLLGVKTAFEQKQAAEKAAREVEEKRIAEEKKEQERIRKENEKLKKERDAERKKAEADRKAAEEKRQQEKDFRFMEAEKFLTENGFEKNDHGFEKDGDHFIGLNHYNDLETDKELEAFKNQVIRHEEIKKERKERERYQKELEEKAEDERKAKELEEAKLQAELSKGDAEKVQDLILDLKNLKTKYTFKSKKNQKIYSDVGILIEKIINHIQK